MSTFQKVYGIDPTNAPRLLDILRNAVLALMEIPEATLLSLSEMLGNPIYRQRIVARVRDPFVRSYWLNEFGRWKPTDQTLAVASVQNKLRPFIMHPLLRPILGQPKNRLNLQKHGVGFADARRAFDDPDRVILDDLDHSKAEPRYFCLGMVDGAVMTVRFTWRRRLLAQGQEDL